MIQHIPFPRQEKKLPVVPSAEEIARLFGALAHLKHRTLLMTIYAAGLRLSEALHLRVADVDSSWMLIRVRRAGNLNVRFR